MAAPPVDLLAAATQNLMAAVQGYVRAAVASEMANGPVQPRLANPDSLRARLDTAIQENRDLTERVKKLENQDKKRETVGRFLSYTGIDFEAQRASRHSAAKLEFHFFKKLPLELRMKIWKFALPGGRIFEMTGPDGHFHRMMRAHDPNQANPATVRMNSGLPEMCVTTHKTPKLRLACKEANAAFKEAGAFEFGLFGGEYKGVWFNHSEDILYLRAEPSSWTNIDMSRIVRVALPHTKLMTKDNCTAKMDTILTHFTSCREVIMLQAVDWDYRSCLPPPRLPAKLYPLQADDTIGHHDYPTEMSTEIGNVAVWRDVKRIVEQLWMEHVVQTKGLSQGKVPKFVGMEMLRAKHTLFD